MKKDVPATFEMCADVKFGIFTHGNDLHEKMTNCIITITKIQDDRVKEWERKRKTSFLNLACPKWKFLALSGVSF